jgi:thiamine transport system ATP-binding protein
MVRAKADMTGARLQLDKVRFAYPGGSEMHFDLDVAAGSVVALLGASGSGKSTLLHLVAGFEEPQDGFILIDGANVTGLDPAKRPVSMVFQENNLFHHLTVAQNVGLGRSPGLKLSGRDRVDIAEALGDVGLAGKEERLPSELSGGERQRVALARALVRRRPLLLLDEPFASLGPALRRDMVDLVRDLAGKTGMTMHGRLPAESSSSPMARSQPTGRPRPSSDRVRRTFSPIMRGVCPRFDGKTPA